MSAAEPISSTELRNVLQDLLMAASRRQRSAAKVVRDELDRAVANAGLALRRPPLVAVEHVDELVSGYVASGGEWQDLVAAVSRGRLGKAGPH